MVVYTSIIYGVDGISATYISVRVTIDIPRRVEYLWCHVMNKRGYLHDIKATISY